MQTALNLKQLNRLIHKLTATYGQTITMKYSIRQGRSESLFEAESEQDLVNSSGIFSKILSSCKFDIFGLCLTYTPEGGYKVWMRAGVSYESFDHGHNGMAIAPAGSMTGNGLPATTRVNMKKMPNNCNIPLAIFCF